MYMQCLFEILSHTSYYGYYFSEYRVAVYNCSYIHVLLLLTSSANIILLRDCVQPLHIAGAGPTLVACGRVVYCS